uniref:Uncharacterized protein n=1 Tax=Anopheles culicifacies TaxID=139723 RepID=A0A182MX58_9DIPT
MTHSGDSALLRSFFAETSSDFGANRLAFLWMPWCPSSSLDVLSIASVLMYVMGVDFLLALPSRIALPACTVCVAVSVSCAFMDLADAEFSATAHPTSIISSSSLRGGKNGRKKKDWKINKLSV